MSNPNMSKIGLDYGLDMNDWDPESDAYIEDGPKSPQFPPNLQRSEKMRIEPKTIGFITADGKLLATIPKAWIDGGGSTVYPVTVETVATVETVETVQIPGCDAAFITLTSLSGARRFNGEQATLADLVASPYQGVLHPITGVLGEKYVDVHAVVGGDLHVYTYKDGTFTRGSISCAELTEWRVESIRFVDDGGKNMITPTIMDLVCAERDRLLLSQMIRAVDNMRSSCVLPSTTSAPSTAATIALYVRCLNLNEETLVRLRHAYER